MFRRAPRENQSTDRSESADDIYWLIWRYIISRAKRTLASNSVVIPYASLLDCLEWVCFKTRFFLVYRAVGGVVVVCDVRGGCLYCCLCCFSVVCIDFVVVCVTVVCIIARLGTYLYKVFVCTYACACKICIHLNCIMRPKACSVQQRPRPAEESYAPTHNPQQAPA